MKKELIINKENPARLLGDYFPEILIDDRKILDQEAEFDIMYKNRLIGRAKLAYRIPYKSSVLRESQTFLIYNRPAHWLHGHLAKQLPQGSYDSQTPLVYVLFQWIEQDLIAFEEIAKEVWENIISHNQSQLHMDYSH